MTNQPPKYHTLTDPTPTPHGPGSFYFLKLLVDSPEGRTFSSLDNESDKLEYIREHAHDKILHVSPQFHFYEDREKGKRWLIRIESEEGREVGELLGDSDDELVEGGEERERLRKYFEDHAHEVETIEVKFQECEIKR